MILTKEIESIMIDYPEYQNMLFIRGYLVTDSEEIKLSEYPFYNNWETQNIGQLSNGKALNIYYHNLQECHIYKCDNISVTIIGHTYNPFDMTFKEEDILKKIYNTYIENGKKFLNLINELTGTYLIVINDHGKVMAIQDSLGLKSCYFGEVDSDIFITSHPQLIGDLNNLEMTNFVTKLINSKMYNIGNRYLPGNISPFNELKRLGPNTFLQFSNNFTINRFYPNKDMKEINNKIEFEKEVDSLLKILRNSMELITLKWKDPAISLTGGTDSKTTLATANGMYDKFKYYSFYSKPAELNDSKAAREICKELNISHNIYQIPVENEKIKDFDIIKKIINHNASYIMNNPDHEIRKMIYLYYKKDFDIEVKSWGGEVARVFYERKYDINFPEKLTPRHFSILQTRYFMTPKLLKKSDLINKDFMNEIKLNEPLYNYEHTDLHYWEVRMGSWGTSVATSLDFCHNVTIPLNNRKILEMFLSFSREDKKNDKVHNELIKKADKRIYDRNINVKNQYFHSYRIFLEKAYYYYRTMFL